MKADEKAGLDVSVIRQLCRRALWDAAPGTHEEMTALVGEAERYIRQLAPEVSQLVPRMAPAMREQAAVVLRHVDEVLDARAPRADVPARLHDLGVVTRALVTLYEQPGDLAPAGGRHAAL